MGAVRSLSIEWVGCACVCVNVWCVRDKADVGWGHGFGVGCILLRGYAFSSIWRDYVRLRCRRGVPRGEGGLRGGRLLVGSWSYHILRLAILKSAMMLPPALRCGILGRFGCYLFGRFFGPCSLANMRTSTMRDTGRHGVTTTCCGALGAR